MSNRKSKKINLLKPVFWAIIFAIFAGSIFMAVDLATSGAEISSLESQVAALTQRNRELTAEIIKNSSVSEVDVASSDLGFNKPEKTVYLTPNQGIFAKLP